MVPRLCHKRGHLVAFFLASFSFLSLVIPPQHSTNISVNSEHASICRHDMEVNRLPPMPEDDSIMLQELFKYLTEPNRSACGRLLRFGGMSILEEHKTARMDGHKLVCVDPEFHLLTTDHCLVYSFGISDDWSFDFDMESFTCTVHAFDPTTNDTAGYQNGTIFFNKYGIGGWDGTDNNLPVRTLDTITTWLGHTDRTIHYLKLDVEECEWDVFDQQVKRGRQSTLFRNVEQLGAELHFSKHMPVTFYGAFYRRAYRALLGLQRMGFYPFAYEPNWASQVISVPGFAESLPSAMEVVWLKSHCVKDPTEAG